MNSIRTYCRRLPLPALLLALAACGGGGGGSSSSKAPANLAYSLNPAVYANGVAIATQVPTWTGKVTSFTVSPALPAGIALDPLTGAISGTPSALAALSGYIVTAQSQFGSTATVLSLAVEAPVRFVVAGNAGDDTLSVYLVDTASGDLRLLGFALPQTGASGTRRIVGHPQGSPVYALSEVSGGISIFDVELESGALLARTSVATGTAPQELLFDPAHAYAYVLTRGDSLVTTYAVDPLDGGLTPLAAPLFVGGQPQAMTMDRSGRYLYVALSSLGEVQAFAIDPATHVPAPIGQSLPTQKLPVALAITPDGRYLYAANLRADSVSIYALDPLTGEMTAVGNEPTGVFPADIAIDTTGRYLYVADSGSDTVRAFRIQASTGGLQPNGAPREAGQRPSALELDATGEHLYSVDLEGNQLWVFDVDPGDGTLAAGRNVHGRDQPVALALLRGDQPLSPKPRYVYVANSGSSDLSVYGANPDSGYLSSISTSIPTGASPKCVVADPRGRFVYAVLGAANTVVTYAVQSVDGDLTATGASAPVGNGASAAAIDPSGRFLYVANYADDTVSVLALDPGTGAPMLASTRSVGDGPIAIEIDPTGRFAYVADHLGNALEMFRIQLFNGALATWMPPVTAGGKPRSLASHPSGRFLYAVTEQNGKALSFDVAALDGALSSLTVQDTGVAPTSIAIDPKGRFAYSANRDPLALGDLSHFTIGAADGDLAFVDAFVAQMTPVAVVCDPAGRFLYALNEGADSVSLYALDQKSGKPTPGQPVSTGVAPISMALIGKLE